MSAAEDDMDLECFDFLAAFGWWRQPDKHIKPGNSVAKHVLGHEACQAALGCPNKSLIEGLRDGQKYGRKPNMMLAQHMADCKACQEIHGVPANCPGRVWPD